MKMTKEWGWNAWASYWERSAARSRWGLNDVLKPHCVLCGRNDFLVKNATCEGEMATTLCEVCQEDVRNAVCRYITRELM